MENNTKESKKQEPGKLYIVSTPIGNKDDITLRALKILKTSDMVVCEEHKTGTRVLRAYNINQKIELLNEHNEDENAPVIISMLMEGKNLALISDHGTPVFADPGLKLVRMALSRGIPIEVIPGTTSLMAAIVRSGFSCNEFLFAGFLNRKREERISELRVLSRETRTVALLETPYRLIQVLEACSTVMPDRNAYLACNLTSHYETHHYGVFSDLYNKFKNLSFKGEFVLIFEGAPKRQRPENKKHGFKNSSRSNDRKGGFKSQDKKRNFKSRNNKKY